MKFKRVWAVYFSPTGTTKKVACHMADELADLLKAKRCDYDFTLPKARAGFASISGADAGDLEASEIRFRSCGICYSYLCGKSTQRAAEISFFYKR